MSVPVNRIAEVVADAVRESLTRLGTPTAQPNQVGAGGLRPSSSGGLRIRPSSSPPDGASSFSRGTGTHVGAGGGVSATTYQRAFVLQTFVTALTDSSPEGRRRFAPPTMFRGKHAKRSESGPKTISYVRDIVCLPQMI